MARADGSYSSFLSPKHETGRAGTWRSALGRTRAPPSHHRLGVGAPSVHHARCRTAQATPVDLAAHAQATPSRAERERGGSAPVPAVRGARAVPAPLRRARAAPAPIWRARARPIAPIVHFREVAEARVLVLVGGTAATATALAPVRVIHGAAHDLRYRAAAPGRAAFVARALAREHVGAAARARPVAGADVTPVTVRILDGEPTAAAADRPVLRQAAGVVHWLNNNTELDQLNYTLCVDGACGPPTKLNAAELWWHQCVGSSRSVPQPNNGLVCAAGGVLRIFGRALAFESGHCARYKPYVHGTAATYARNSRRPPRSRR